MTDQKHRRVKKSETLEVRIPYETKQAFLTACREDGTTASEVVRESVQTYLDERERPIPQEKRTLIMKLPQPVRRYGLRAVAGGAIAAGFVATAVLPSAASPDFQAAFKRLDANGDGVLTAEEFAGPKDGDEVKNVVVDTRHVVRSSNGSASSAAAAGTKLEAFAFWLPGDATPDGAEQQHEYKFVSERSVVIKADGESGAPPAATFSMEDIRKREFEKLDGDRDGKVSLAEFEARQRAMLTRGFEILDTNRDKALSAEEYVKIASPPMIKLNPDDPDTPTPPDVNIGPKISTEALRANFAKLDANKDSKLSLQEYLPPV